MTLPKIDLKAATSVAVGVALFGVAVWAIRMLPANAVTTPIKKVADITTTR